MFICNYTLANISVLTSIIRHINIKIRQWGNCQLCPDSTWPQFKKKFLLMDAAWSFCAETRHGKAVLRFLQLYVYLSEKKDAQWSNSRIRLYYTVKWMLLSSHFDLYPATDHDIWVARAVLHIWSDTSLLAQLFECSSSWANSSIVMGRKSSRKVICFLFKVKHQRINMWVKKTLDCT